MNFSSFFNINNKDTKKITETATTTVISEVYENSAKEIESLRKYDRGEKNIDAPDLRNIVQTL